MAEKIVPGNSCDYSLMECLNEATATFEFTFTTTGTAGRNFNYCEDHGIKAAYADGFKLVALL